MSRIRTKVDSNLWVKVLALISAIALWFFVMNEQNPMGEASYTVPVSVIDAPEGMKVTLEDDTVRLKLRAPRSFFASLDKEELKVLASVAGLEEGSSTVKLQAIVPQGFELVGTSPEKIVVRLEPIVERQFEVSLIRAGNVAQGMTVAAIQPQQRLVTVVGPKAKIDSISRVIGYVGLNTERTQDFTLDVPLSAVTAEGRGVTEVKLAPGVIKVDVQLVQGLTKKTVDVKPLFDGTLQNGYTLGKVSITPAKLEIAGTANAMSNITSLYTEKIPLEELTKSGKHRLGLTLPDGITAAVDQVTVEIEINNK